MGVEVSMSVSVVVAVRGAMFQFVTMAMVSVAVGLVQSTVKEGMAMSMARAVRMSMAAVLENKDSY